MNIDPCLSTCGAYQAFVKHLLLLELCTPTSQSTQLFMGALKSSYYLHVEQYVVSNIILDLDGRGELTIYGNLNKKVG